MKIAALAQLVLISAVAAAAAQAPAKTPTPADSTTATISVGESLPVKLPCTPGTGYAWEVKSVNRKIAAPADGVAFMADESKPGMVGGGGTCVATFTGVKPGKTTAVLVYRRSWEKKEPAKTYTVRIRVTAKKSH